MWVGYSHIGDEVKLSCFVRACTRQRMVLLNNEFQRNVNYIVITEIKLTNTPEKKLFQAGLGELKC